MDPGCERVEIPRFVIQPLVENYFVHGVDLKRKDNALSVKALKHGQDMEILIRDNGKGMNAETLKPTNTSWQVENCRKKIGHNQSDYETFTSGYFSILETVTR